MKFKSLILVMSSVVNFSAMAMSVDLRHEWMDTSKGDHKNRMLISHRFDNGFGFSLEAKWKQDSTDSTPDKPFHEQVSGGTEAVVSYQYKVNDVFNLQPGFSIESTSNNNGYRPFLRTQYNLTKDVYVAARYRYEYKRTTSKGSEGDEKTNRGDFWLGYKFFKDWQVEYNYVYKNSNKVIFDDGKTDYEHNVKLAYKWDKNWKPYIEVGNVKQDSKNDNRQTRFRVGVNYSW
ncbi:oligogalacturonate-specific porin KdgM family protein [Serratia sp. UGAL515B_01]|uniref:oligogalacturonate-specific porin KdgM family protein n=1 Tax=Serratia sp. UGAL515B_01 TaxID=2986763 RepID=UPI002954A6FD|nr:oligogalacturonate-specific porin KdgM family protein [Serratia sp. UGAL515B_01]WON75662.1 oligogalacturonate-specific porin KdgM family protein [Serratia sp. UGAL515B_01]